MPAVRAAVAAVVESERYDRWLMEVSDEMLVRVAASLEMLQYQFYAQPSRDRHLVRAARVCCEASAPGIGSCPKEMVEAFARLAEAVGPAANDIKRVAS